MPKDQTTLVLPGGNTRCIFSTSTPFAFQVVPGSSDKVLLYFQGGGACWDEASTKAGFCTTDSSPQSLVGIFDRNEPLNKYKDYTIVHVSYCSGDLFGGDVVRDYTDSAGVPVIQKGYENGLSAVNWIQQQQASGALSSTLSDLVVMGCSAGSIGAQIWSDNSLNMIKWQKAAVIPDSYAGVFPDGSQGPLIYGFGMCSVGKDFLSEANYQKCIEQTLTLQDINLQFIPQHSDVPFSFIQSKTDIVQQSFYTAVGLSMGLPALETPAEFYDKVNTIFEAYNTNPNFLTYLVSGDQHCFTPMSLYYTADAVSNKDDGDNTNQQMMYDWTNKFPLAESETEVTVCEGTVQSSKKGLYGANSTTYCASELFPKQYTEDYN
eukprot:CAMPEP_0174820236 /NCGR_PEP_ID=MMETSP1107-20130205/3928_1 /TAXON_ID=36770 /ORGANISM="Paraphysomonas vestita, Strain GFlagA" /LENGTH=376 /DNA_ID=CAMNT_0016035169 /DNA_START=214 /DNA_END=1344 /DNA_ORIENTATION=+